MNVNVLVFYNSNQSQSLVLLIFSVSLLLAFFDDAEIPLNYWNVYLGCSDTGWLLMAHWLSGTWRKKMEEFMAALPATRLGQTQWPPSSLTLVSATDHKTIIHPSISYTCLCFRGGPGGKVYPGQIVSQSQSGHIETIHTTHIPHCEAASEHMQSNGNK